MAQLYLYTYDGSFEGLLTVVFEAYERKVWPTAIEQEKLAQPSMFGETIAVITDEQKASRVWKGLQRKLSPSALEALYYTYLGEQPGFEQLVFAYARLVFDHQQSVEGNYTAPCVLQVQQIQKQVHREKHRMEAFVRFQKTADGLYYATISPDFNVLPLIIPHFEKRYSPISKSAIPTSGGPSTTPGAAMGFIMTCSMPNSSSWKRRGRSGKQDWLPISWMKKN